MITFSLFKDFLKHLSKFVSIHIKKKIYYHWQKYGINILYVTTNNKKYAF